MAEYLRDDNYPPIVLDNGSCDIKAGFAGDDGPLSVFSNVIGHSQSKDECFIGDKAQEKREILSLQRPMEHGIVVDWHAMEKIWNFTFTEMHVSPYNHPVLTAERPFNPRGNRETSAQVMFESFNVPAFYVAFDPVLALYSGGKTWGTMVDVGDGVTHVVPISEGVAPKNVMKRLDIAGNDVTMQLQRLLWEKGLIFTTTGEIDILREIKEKCCFVKEKMLSSSDIISCSNSKDKEVRYKLPDGQSINLGSECFMCSEILFSYNGVNLEGLVADSLNACDSANRKYLTSNIIVSGGTTCFPGFIMRLQRELNSVLPDSLKDSVQIRGYPERKYLTWIGGSILASLTTFDRMWISKSEYNECGPNVVHRKCL